MKQKVDWQLSLQIGYAEPEASMAAAKTEESEELQPDKYNYGPRVTHG